MIGTAKWTFKLPRFTVSKGPPPKLLNAGVPVATWAEVIVPKPKRAAAKYRVQIVRFIIAFSPFLRSLQDVQTICQPRVEDRICHRDIQHHTAIEHLLEMKWDHNPADRLIACKADFHWDICIHVLVSMCPDRN